MEIPSEAEDDAPSPVDAKEKIASPVDAKEKIASPDVKEDVSSPVESDVNESVISEEPMISVEPMKPLASGSEAVAAEATPVSQESSPATPSEEKQPVEKEERRYRNRRLHSPREGEVEES